MIVLGGSLHHPGGLESYCERAAAAIQRHGEGWSAEWWPTDTAYLELRRLPAVRAAWARAGRLSGVDLVWLQWSTLADLIFLGRAKARGVPVLVTPHLGAAARLQRVPLLRRLCLRLLADADRLGLLFDGQEAEIALPPRLPRDAVGTFLPEEALAGPLPVRGGAGLHLVHAGRLSAAKGSFRMVALAAALRDRGVAVTGEIIGRADPATMAALHEAVAAAGLADTLRFAGWMDGPALRAALGRADVLVHLSELDSFPLIVLEALAAGAMPVVAEMAGAAAMVRRYDGFVAPGGVDAAADWLAAQDPAALRRRGAEAAARVRDDHRWAEMAARLERIADATA